MKEEAHDKAAGTGDGDIKLPKPSWSTRTPPPVINTIIGALVLLALLGTMIYTPGLLPHVFLLFTVIGLPWRIVDFSLRKYAFFLIDFCYFVNLSVVVYLTLEPLNPGRHALLWRGLEAGMYVLAEGPLAAALIAWRCSWVLGWADYTISVLIHLLPGLAMAAHRHVWSSQPSEAFVPTATPHTSLIDSLQVGIQTWNLTELKAEVCTWASQDNLDIALQAQSLREQQPRILFGFERHSWQLLRRLCSSSSATMPAQSVLLPGVKAWAGAWHDCGECSPSTCPLGNHMDVCCWAGWGTWLVVFPLVAYGVWQLLYFMTVQVFCLPMIKRNRFDTSFKSLARRAKKSGGGLLSNFILQGSTARQLIAFGLVQLGFTLSTMCIGIISYHSPWAALAWQVFKFTLPLSAGWQDTNRAYAYLRALKKAEKFKTE